MFGEFCGLPGTVLLAFGVFLRLPQLHLPIQGKEVEDDVQGLVPVLERHADAGEEGFLPRLGDAECLELGLHNSSWNVLSRISSFEGTRCNALHSRALSCLQLSVL